MLFALVVMAGVLLLTMVVNPERGAVEGRGCSSGAPGTAQAANTSVHHPLQLFEKPVNRLRPEVARQCHPVLESELADVLREVFRSRHLGILDQQGNYRHPLA